MVTVAMEEKVPDPSMLRSIMNPISSSDASVHSISTENGFALIKPSDSGELGGPKASFNGASMILSNTIPPCLLES